MQGLQFTIRRFGLFHAKMAGSRLVLNQYWGTPGSAVAGTLWKENHVASRKPITAGWKAARFPPWKVIHELLYISAAAHVQDAIRTHLRVDSLTAWAERVTPEDFERVSLKVFEDFFRSEVVDEYRHQKSEEQDHIHENTLLYNRDVLIYLEFCNAIRAGDVGRILNVLRTWMVMMRGENHMPKYADAIFETLGRLETYPEPLETHTLVLVETPN
jgi:hypothetical protein